MNAPRDARRVKRATGKSLLGRFPERPTSWFNVGPPAVDEVLPSVDPPLPSPGASALTQKTNHGGTPAAQLTVRSLGRHQFNNL